MPLNTNTFHLSLSTKTFNGTIFSKFNSFCFFSSFECLTCGNSSIFAIVSLVSSTRTPYTTNFYHIRISQDDTLINSFTRWWIGLSSRLRRSPTPICFAEPTSLPTIHLYGLSILVKMTFLLEMDTTCFSCWFTLSKLISCSKFGSSSLNDWPLNIFFALSLLMLPFMIIKNESNTTPNMKGNKYEKGHNKRGNEHLTILTTWRNKKLAKSTWIVEVLK